MIFRICKNCAIKKNLEEFHKSSGYFLYTCKKCFQLQRRVHVSSEKWKNEFKRRSNLSGRKICATCNHLKDLDEFYKNQGKVDGRHSNCKNCYKEKIIIK